MTDVKPSARLAYDDAATPQEMSEDCRVLGRDPRFRQVAKAATGPAPSIHFEDYPREVGKREIRISDAATRLANALHLHLD